MLASSVVGAACSPSDDADPSRAEPELGVRPKDDGTRLTIAFPAGWATPARARARVVAARHIGTPQRGRVSCRAA